MLPRGRVAESQRPAAGAAQDRGACARTFSLDRFSRWEVDSGRKLDFEKPLAMTACNRMFTLTALPLLLLAPAQGRP